MKPLSLKQQFDHTDAELVERKPLYQGFFSMMQYKLRHKLFRGGWSQPIVREVFERGHAAVLLPYDPIQDAVVLQEQFRVGAVGQGKNPWLLELVAGIIGEGETPEGVAVREAREEANLEVKRIKKLYSYLASPGGCTERIDIFIGEVDSQGAGGVYGLESENEDIKVHLVSREQALALLNKGEFDNAATIIALQWLQHHGQQLQDAWSTQD